MKPHMRRRRFIVSFSADKKPTAKLVAVAIALTGTSNIKCSRVIDIGHARTTVPEVKPAYPEAGHRLMTGRAVARTRL